jgi:hypothetical protein
MRNKKMKIDRINNRPMNKETYALKTTVINLIREAKIGGAKLPWIGVKIGNQTSNHKNVLGCAIMQGDRLWITEDAINLGTDALRNIVFHEIAHAVFGTQHDESCPLMSAELGTILNKEDCLKHLLKYQQ